MQLSADGGFRVVTLNSRIIDFRRFGKTCRLHQGSSGPVTPHQPVYFALCCSADCMHVLIVWAYFRQ